MTILTPVDPTARGLAQRSLGPVFSVAFYGATLDGATDDHAAVQSAIDAAVAAGGGTVYFPGLARVASEVSITSSVGITLLGSGREASGLKAASQSMGRLLHITGSNVLCQRMGFDGAYASGASSGTAGLIEVDDAADVRLSDCLLHNALRNGIVIRGGCLGVRLVDSKLTNNYCGVRSFANAAGTTVPKAVSVLHCDIVNNWSHSADDQTGGVKLESGVAGLESYGHCVADCTITDAGLLGVEYWGGGGKMLRSTARGNTITGTTSGEQFGVSFNDCTDCIAAENIIRLHYGFVGVEFANACVRCEGIGNTVNFFGADGTTKRGSGAGLGLFNNVGAAPTQCAFRGNIVTGSYYGIHNQVADHTTLHDNTIIDVGGDMLFFQGGTNIAATYNNLRGSCSSFLYIDVSFMNVSDIEYAHNILAGAASFNGIWAYNNSTSYTLSNCLIDANNAEQATYGNLSTQLIFDSSEMVNVRFTNNIYATTASHVQLPDWYSADLTPPAYGASSQAFSIPIAAKISFAVPASTGEVWYRVFYHVYGQPIALALHVKSDFIANASCAAAQTFFVAASPYNQSSTITLLPNGSYASPLKGVIYNNPTDTAYHEIWLHFGPVTGAGTVTIGGGDYASQWIAAPTRVTTEPTWGSNKFEVAAAEIYSALRSKKMSWDINQGYEVSAAPTDTLPTGGFLIYAKRNGSNKSSLWVRFGANSEQQIIAAP